MRPMMPSLVGWCGVYFLFVTEGIWQRFMDVAQGYVEDVCANSGPFIREREKGCRVPAHWDMLSSPFRHASGSAVSSPMGVGVRSIRHIASAWDLF